MKVQRPQGSASLSKAGQVQLHTPKFTQQLRQHDSLVRGYRHETAWSTAVGANNLLETGYERQARQRLLYKGASCVLVRAIAQGVQYSAVVQPRTCRGGAQAWVLYTMRSSATASTWPGEKHGSAFSPPSFTFAAAAASRTCARPRGPRQDRNASAIAAGAEQTGASDAQRNSHSRCVSLTVCTRMLPSLTMRQGAVGTWPANLL